VNVREIDSGVRGRASTSWPISCQIRVISSGGVAWDRAVAPRSNVLQSLWVGSASSLGLTWYMTMTVSGSSSGTAATAGT